MKPRITKCGYNRYMCSSVRISAIGTKTTLQGFGATPKSSYVDWVRQCQDFEYWVDTGKHRKV